MWKRVVGVVCVLACAASASAQVGLTVKTQVWQLPLPAGIDLQVTTPFRESAATVITAADCGKPQFVGLVPSVETNPRTAIWLDPSTALLPPAQQLICTKDQSAFFAALPVRGSATVGGYVTTVSVTSLVDPVTALTSTSPRSAVSNPFSLLPLPPPVPPAPTGHQVRP